MRSATRPGRWLVTAAALIAAAGLCTPARAQAVLDVPYVPQSEDLCGGAAAAMVMRYWGEPAVYAAAFAPLVDRSAHGIRTGTLSADLRRRGWTAVDGPGTLSDLTRELGRARPVITLIEVRPNRYHYVVVVAARDTQIVLHDPARAPSRTLTPAAFDAAWAKADRWMLILLPPSDRLLGETLARPGSGSDPGTPAAGSPGGTPGACGVDEGVRLANDGDYAAARKALDAA